MLQVTEFMPVYIFLSMWCMHACKPVADVDVSLAE